VADDAADTASSPEPVDRTRSASNDDSRPVASIKEPAREIDTPNPAASQIRRWLSRRNLAFSLVLLAMLAMLAVEIRFIASEAALRTPGPPTGSSPVASAAAQSQKPAIAPAPSSVASTDVAAVPTAAVPEEVFDDEPKPTKPERPKQFSTVEEASVGSCSTASVDGLSRQIIEQVRCINPSALMPIPARSNLVLDANIFPYLEASARSHFLRALDAHRDQTMKVHSVLRTVAQQYLVRRWAAGRRCGVQMATPPGGSNHETGRALDIGDEGRWRSALEAEGFHWLGAADNVHFDFIANGNSGSQQHGLDVLAFQRLWNRNHRDDPIAEDGRYSPGIEQRLKKSPPKGFPVGPSCSTRPRAGTATIPRKSAVGLEQ
jgi:hypothetical protein